VSNIELKPFADNCYGNTGDDDDSAGDDDDSASD